MDSEEHGQGQGQGSLPQSQTEKKLDCPPPWKQRIEEAKARRANGSGGFTEADKTDACGWACCAVGERVQVITGQSNKDALGFSLTLWRSDLPEEIESLGCRFANAVCGDRVEQAEHIWAEIQTWDGTLDPEEDCSRYDEDDDEDDDDGDY